MKYKLLSSIFYSNNNEFEQEYKKRISMGTELNFLIGSYPAFYINTMELALLSEQILCNQIKLSKVIASIPLVALNKYSQECLIDEIIQTNDIEGINSTRKDVLTVLDVNSDKKAKFSGMIKKYTLLVEEDYHIDLSSPQSIRDLYDEIVLPEINKNNIPDGTIFRKESVEVTSATGKSKHKGIVGENNIIEYMEKAIQIKDNPDIPILTRIALFHYLIGYIHPFYDGNGRLSRFISSYMLSGVFGSFVAYHLSYVIKDNKNDYYKAFDNCNNEKNRGDLTPFIIMFYDMINKSISTLLEKLSDANEKFIYYENLLDDNTLSLKPLSCTLLNLFIQNALFSYEPFCINELQQLTGKSRNTIISELDNLKQMNFHIELSKKGNKHFYKLDLQSLESVLKQK